MARTRYASDPGLIARMGATMFLLGLVFVAFGVGLVYLIAFASTYKHGGSGVSSLSGDSIIIFAVIIGVVSALASYFWSDKIALRTSRARLVGPNDGPEAARLHAIVDRLCAMADMPKPRIAIAPTQMPNAFATGRNSKTAVLCATSGIMDPRRLTNEELEGVIAHEMSHVAHKDVAVMTIASFLGIIAALMVRMAFYGELFGGRGRSNNQFTAILLPLMMLLSIVTYVVSFLLIRMLSRYRELAADRSGALLTGQPSALASALVKVSGDMARIPTRDLRAAEPLNAFYFTPALKSGQGGGGLANVFSTHPSLQKRLAQLEKISKQLGQQQLH
jgi:heat shock protein HtpX